MLKRSNDHDSICHGYCHMLEVFDDRDTMVYVAVIAKC